MPYLYKRIKTKHKDFITRTKIFYSPSGMNRPRGVRRCPTGEGKKERNRRNAYIKRKVDIYNNFDIGDIWATLTWKESALPDTPEEAHRLLMKALSKIRRVLAKEGIPLVYYVKTEAGDNTRVHHHLFIKNNFSVIQMLFGVWKNYGKVKDFQEIYDFKSGKLVKYFLDTDHKGLDFEKYAHSRNFKPVEVEKRIYPFDSFRENPRPPKDEDGIHYQIANLYNGFPDIDGYIYQEYELIKHRIE